MSKREERFDVPEAFRIEAVTSSGDITVRSGDAGEVVVRVTGPGADDYEITQVGDTIRVVPEAAAGLLRRFSSADVTLTVPEGGSLDFTSGSGDVGVQPHVTRLEATTASGEIRARTVGDTARLRSASGDVHLDGVDGRLVVDSASGDVRVGRVGHDLTATTASGNIDVGYVGGAIDVNTASGDLTVRHVDGEDVRVKSVSGDLRLGIPPRRTIEVDVQTLSGDVRNRLPQGDGSPPEKRIGIRAKTLSGDVTLQGI